MLQRQRIPKTSKTQAIFGCKQDLENIFISKRCTRNEKRVSFFLIFFFEPYKWLETISGNVLCHLVINESLRETSVMCGKHLCHFVIFRDFQED